ncbi:MAG TPA: hypothetical protein PLT28_11735 [Saprospiraceae bacterium]|nr:hypothetical protein [Saprospiraceae bacterium]
MPREAGLFEAANGNPFEGFLLLRQQGGNIPPSWIERSTESRKNTEKELGGLLKSGDFDAVHKLKEWEEKYRKECFYYGLRALLELERNGKTEY